MQFRLACILTLIVHLAATGNLPAAAPQAGLIVDRSAKTGRATFVRAANGTAIADLVGAAAAADPAVIAREAMRSPIGKLFGVQDPDRELALESVTADNLGHTHIKFVQTYKGVGVFGGRLHVHQNEIGGIISANGSIFPIPASLSVIPTQTSQEAIRRARAALGEGNTPMERGELVVVDPGWYGDPPAGVHLAYHLIVADEAAGIREAFFVDAHTGKILDRWNLLHTARSRRIIDDRTDLVVRLEGGPPTGDFDADAAYDYAGDTYDFLFRAFGRDGLDDDGAVLQATVHLQHNCPNAYGGASGTWFCDGVATDDIVAHEFTHGLTALTAGLIYQNQPGQLNESFSDVFGEAVDLLNGDAAYPGPPDGTPWPAHATGPGTDTPNETRQGCVPIALVNVSTPPSIAGDYSAQPASFGPALTTVGVSANVAVANPVRACNADMPFANAGSLFGRIVVVDRGDCPFAEKVKNAQLVGAVGVVVVNNLTTGLPPMGGSDATITIPSVGISQADGNLIKSAAASGTVHATLRKNPDPPVRWMVGEDATGFGGAIRDMWQPSCMGDPDHANHPLQTCPSEDNGGVHSGSGVPNHAFAMLVDGKDYNDQIVSGIGLFKAAAVWYRALTVYLTPTSDFGDAYIALNQAANDLVGQLMIDPRDGSDHGIFTSQDAADVNSALLAVEMDTLGRCGANEIMIPTPPTLCADRMSVYFDAFSPGNPNGWTTEVSGPAGPPTPYTWILVNGALPAGQAGTAWFGEDRNIGNCQSVDESAVHSLISPAMQLPGNTATPMATITHFVATEPGFDGGNVKISVNGGAWQLIPASAFLYNPYNTVLISSSAGNSNPMAGQEAWSGGTSSANTWGTSLIDLSTLAQPGDSVRFRFDLGKDGCSGAEGWYIDQFELFTCPYLDCNENNVSDSSDIGGAVSPDCDINGIPDECQIVAGSPAPGGPFYCTFSCSSDCNVNAIPDECEMVDNDCNGNLVPDECDLASGYPDLDGDSIPDVCEIPTVDVPPGEPLRTRFLSFAVPPSQIGGLSESALRVRMVSLHHVDPPYSGGDSIPFTAFEGQIRWAGPPNSYVETPGGLPFIAASLQCEPHYQDWSTVEMLHVTGSAVVPSSIYEVENVSAGCMGSEDSCTVFSASVVIATTRWGDVTAPYNPPSKSVQPDVTDLSTLVDKFRNIFGAITKARALQAAEPGNVFGEITPAVLNVEFGFSHISTCVDAYRGVPYPYTIRVCP